MEKEDCAGKKKKKKEIGGFVWHENRTDLIITGNENSKLKLCTRSKEITEVFRNLP
jgi:hypothetical protein